MPPFAFDLLDEEQQKKNQEAQGSEMGAPAMTGGGETFSQGSAQPASQNPQAKGTNRQGSGFVGLDKYMAANKGSGFGNQFTGNVQSSINTAKQGLEKSAQDFTQASNQGTTRWNDVEDPLKNIVDNAGSGTSSEDISKVKGWTGAQYQGPESYGQTAFGAQGLGGVQKATQQGKALQSEGGRFALLDQFYGKPKYSMGEKSLDNLLVQNAPGVAARAQSLGAQSNQLQQAAGKTARDLDTLAVSNKQTTQDTAGKATEYIAGALKNSQDAINSKVEAINKDREKEIEETRNLISMGIISPELAKTLGITGEETIYDIDPSQYFTGGSVLNKNQVMTPEEQARIRALNQLSGTEDTFASDPLSDPSDPYSFDVDRFKSDIQNASGRYLDNVGRVYESLRGLRPLETQYMPNDFFRNITPQTNPADVVKEIDRQLKVLPPGSAQHEAFTKAKSEVLGVIDRFRIDPKTGLPKSLTDQAKVPQSPAEWLYRG